MCEAIQPSPIHEFYVNMVFVECRLVLTKFRGFVVKLLLIECVLILLKFKVFLVFPKFKGVFIKLP